jgi:hypothetical protein
MSAGVEKASMLVNQKYSATSVLGFQASLLSLGIALDEVAKSENKCDEALAQAEKLRRLSETIERR